MATSACRIRQGTLGKHRLRLVLKDGHYFGMADGKRCVDGNDADELW